MVVKKKIIVLPSSDLAVPPHDMREKGADNAENSEKMPENDGHTEGGDFYMEDGFMVFTERYHARRGYCCESGCRHCPYGFKK